MMRTLFQLNSPMLFSLALAASAQVNTPMHAKPIPGANSGSCCYREI
jgi:hypothetical protein